ncbi:MAG TPA: hypothetical protein VEL31_13635 [Ktedonobacteraceae bacterium]|nr:hypothetical protein [Ktedonobacteraceae bacterium]
MDKQVWFCEVCRQGGCVRFEPHIDVSSAVDIISRSHRQDSPNCTNGVRGLRVINTGIITSKETLIF